MTLPSTRVFVRFGDVPLAEPSEDVPGFIEVTDEVRQVSTSRGRSWQLDKFQAGAANVVLANERRQFDPTNPPDLAQRENLSPNPSFEVDVSGYSASGTALTRGETQRINLIDNPSFEVSLAGWSGSACEVTGSAAFVSVTDVEQVFGTQSASVALEPLATGNGIHYILPNLPEGTPFAVTAFVKPGPHTTARLKTRDTFHGVNGVTSASAPSGEWTRLSSIITTGTGVSFLLDESELDDPAVTLGGDTAVLEVGIDGEAIPFGGELILDDQTGAGLLDTGVLGATPFFYVDAVMIEQTNQVEPYFDGSDADDSLNDGIVSWQGTPQLSRSVLTWVIPSIAQDSTLSRFGSESLRVDCATRWAGQGVSTIITGLDANTTYIASVFARIGQGSGVRLATRDVTNGISGTVSSVLASSDSTWTRLSSVITTGSNPADVLLAVRTESDFIQPGAGPFSVFYIDAVVFETGSRLQPYFDGDDVDPVIAFPDPSWQGTPGLSRSDISFRVPDTGSPYWPEVKPRKDVVIMVDDVPIFTGTIEDWDYDYPKSNDSRATIKASDAFAYFANALIDPVQVPVEGTGARVTRILDLPEIDWPSDRRDIDTGDATLSQQDIGGDTDPAPVNALQYLQDVEEAEQGALFITGAGDFKFRERTAGEDSPQCSGTLSPVQFRDDGTCIPFMEIDIDYGIEALRNRVVINIIDGPLITVEDPASIEEYGPFALEVRDSLLEDDTQATDWATRIVEQYAEPVLRVSRIVVDLRSLSPEQTQTILALEMGDITSVTFTPNQIGSPIVQTVRIDAISHDVQIADHRVSFDVSQIDVVEDE